MPSKKINRNGSITLPKQLRTQAGLFAGNAVDIEHNGNEIIIRKHTKTCNFCGNAENVKTVMGIDICYGCATKIHRAVICDD
ncbi:MAG: AbrB/MazE/SpoVT family DNA-binding domain-containing protein [Acutalibacteraceae bacterium]|nr:AbrB/MazE/SpoVT family DNA-binding domain-containing protein [Acutalibacteraceae bacterium]